MISSRIPAWSTAEDQALSVPEPFPSSARSALRASAQKEDCAFAKTQKRRAAAEPRKRRKRNRGVAVGALLLLRFRRFAPPRRRKIALLRRRKSERHAFAQSRKSEEPRQSRGRGETGGARSALCFFCAFGASRLRAEGRLRFCEDAKAKSRGRAAGEDKRKKTGRCAARPVGVVRFFWASR